ncbi:RNA-directed DNA polymerase from mobile element jockey-like protein [Labeo rohita]|uniref:RNA-directed DNA polymerase from mobile element jockey-like protein n=1 Tax=Labeo rohita TaxID=84645 RepID=A0A498P2N7_LABRO|nr:RNA-directed DNA polymerase from mobile element jockey-like protein [Labeo rohita]RXN38318.1 RNA-directed DNA polymerase from mobile element jockey-like protein [Labeo rohita]
MDKADYRRRIEDHLGSNNSRQVWHGVQNLTNYRTNIGATDGDLALAEELNIIFARFEAGAETAQPHQAHSSMILTFEEHETNDIEVPE